MGFVDALECLNGQFLLKLIKMFTFSFQVFVFCLCLNCRRVFCLLQVVSNQTWGSTGSVWNNCWYVKINLHFDFLFSVVLSNC